MPRNLPFCPTRTAVLALSGFVSLLAIASPASADVEYPWCMMQGRHTPQSCTFTTVEQCRASLAGSAGYCDRNPRYIAARPVKPRR
jgi:hypothetical protein